MATDLSPRLTSHLSLGRQMQLLGIWLNLSHEHHQRLWCLPEVTLEETWCVIKKKFFLYYMYNHPQ